MSEDADAELIEGAGADLFDPAWYRARHPDVAWAGTSPARHYLRLGAALGRDPGPGFETRFYLAAYPDVAAAGRNPLVHYLRSGRAEGRAPTAWRHALAPALPRLAGILEHLQELGFDAAPLAELERLAAEDTSPALRARAAEERMLWALRGGTAEAAREALGWLRAARRGGRDLVARGHLAVAEMLARHLAGAPAEEVAAAYAVAVTLGADGAETDLVRGNTEADPAARLAWINRALARFALPPLALEPGPGPAFDRLRAAATPAPVPEGPLVTVLVAAHDAEATLATALASLSAQSWRALEILVIDDASADGTARIAEAAAAGDPRIRLIRQPVNRGAYAARNRGLAEARGAYVTLHDADDWAHPLRIAAQAAHLEAHPDQVACLGQQARLRGDLSALRWTGHARTIFENTASLMIRRAPLLDRLGGWDEVRVSADNELIRRAGRVFGPEAVARLATGPATLQRDRPGSAVGDPVLGIAGFLYGARREYRGAQALHHETAAELRYDPAARARPFPAPARMQLVPPRTPLRAGIILAGDLRVGGQGAAALAVRAAGARLHGWGIAEIHRYAPGAGATMDGAVRRAIHAAGWPVFTHGDHVACDRLILWDPAVLAHPQRYLPRIEAARIEIVADAASTISDPETCRATIARFATGPVRWCAADPAGRAALAAAGCEAGAWQVPEDVPGAG
ncbi:glycosyltransferase family A protein [Roseivivax isoporae]|uniref:Glycosyltransferase 2-like domain-containing protein n=1 Tax=Roseivivax isoporae LMG 25204 TaxID=1449351 RepID=X7F4H6_9RHOB|nr:glycosyltransferase family A protein [Roseivivax isoporae]ETX26986.1 hypothetical protein RISW2_17125 [Roseivivax isoporae LMG 25204]